MIVKKALLKNLKEIAELYYIQMSNQFRLVNEESISAQKYESILKKNFEKSEMYILFDVGIKGFLWYFKENDEYNLEEIFVLEKQKGYGKILMNFLIEEARRNKIRRINLDVHFKNKQAQNFFRRYNFSERTIEMSLDLK